jgi:outer membrane protein
MIDPRPKTRDPETKDQRPETMFRVLLTVGITAMAWTASAQDAPVRLTPADAVARGLANSQRLAELQAREEGAEAAVAGRAAASKPLIALQGGYTRTNHVEEFGIAQPGQPPRIIYPDVPDNFRTRIDLQWAIYTGGRTDALARAARAERDAAGEDLAAARADLRLEITRAFWALVTARDTEQVLARSLDSLEAHMRDLRSRLEQGLIPPNEVLSAEAQHSRERVVAIDARNARAIAEADLRRLLGMEREEPLEPAVTLEPSPVADASADALVAEARARRAERRALERRADAMRARGDAAGSAGLPQIGIASGYDYARPNARIFPRDAEWRDSWDVSVNVSWLLWDGGRRRAELAEAAAGARAADARVSEFDRQAAFEVRQRRLELDSSRAAIAAASDGVRSATEARRVVGERFRAGVATSTDLLDAEIAVLQAELDRTRALANARLAEARLERAVGR